MYQGVYNDKSYHPPDLDAVLQRAWDAGALTLFVAPPCLPTLQFHGWRHRSPAAGLERLIITAGNLAEAKAALVLARTHGGAGQRRRLRTHCVVLLTVGAWPALAPAERLFSTVGVHPTRCGEFESHPGGPDVYLAELAAVLHDGLSDGKVVAVGETGLDYDRRVVATMPWLLVPLLAGITRTACAPSVPCP